MDTAAGVDATGGLHTLRARELPAWLQRHACSLRHPGLVHPCVSAEWWTVYARHLLPEGAQILGLPGAAGQPAWLLVQPEPGLPWQTMGNFYTALAGPAEVADVSPLAAALCAQRPRLGVVRLAPLHAPVAQALCASLRHAGWWASPYEAFGNWCLPVAQAEGERLAFEDYMRQRPSTLHNTWRRKARPFDGRGAGALQIVTHPLQLPAALEAYEAVYARSWKPVEASPAFLRDWAGSCAEAGTLRLGLAHWQGQPVAAQFWVVVAGQAHIFKLAYDQHHAALSAGTVLTAHMMRHAIDVDRVALVDYGSGDDAYKRDWMTLRRQRLGVLAGDPATLRGWMARLREGLGSVRRRWRG